MNTFNRITCLLETNREDKYSNLYTKPDPKSLFDVIRFFDSNFNLKPPSLTLSPQGTFRCTWKDVDYHFAAEFYGGDIIRYVAFYKLVSGRMLRYAAISDISFVVTIVSQLH